MRNGGKKNNLTCRCVFELFAFLLPPLPGLENPPQVGKLTPPPDGWGVGTWHEGVRTHGRQPLHFLRCFPRERDGNREGEGGKKVLKWDPHRWPAFSMVTDNRNHMTEAPFLFSASWVGSHTDGF